MQATLSPKFAASGPAEPTPPVRASRGPAHDEQAIVSRVLGGDEAAFAILLRRHHRQMVRLAGCYVDDHDSAERIAREAWAIALERLEGFDGRYPLKVWLAKLLAGQQSAQPAPFRVADGIVCDWTSGQDLPTGAGQRQIARRAIAALPSLQRRVITLRDVDGWSARDVSQLLGISVVEQRRLLHAARTEVCAALETYRGIVALDEVGR